MPRRVVITAFSILSPLGSSPDTIMDNFKKGNAPFEISPIDDDILICPVKNFNLKDHIGRFKHARYLERGAQFCVASAVDTVKNADLQDDTLAKAGLFIGSGPSLDFGEELSYLNPDNPDLSKLKALWMLKYLSNTAASVISRLTGIHGDNATIGTACSATLQAIGEAFRKIKDGYLDLAFAGGGSSRFSYSGIMAYKKAQAFFVVKKGRDNNYSPFDTSRQGFVAGEGGAFILLEELEHAKKRGAEIHAEICGFNASISGHSMTAPDPEGKYEEATVRSAINDAGLMPSDVDVVSTHGTGTPLNDDMEAELIDRVYGDHKPFILALKSWIGHLTPACGAVELALCIILMKHKYLPEIRHLTNPCHKSLNFVQNGINYPPNTVLLENFGFGGQNSAIVIKPWTE